MLPRKSNTCPTRNKGLFRQQQKLNKKSFIIAPFIAQITKIGPAEATAANTHNKKNYNV